LSTCLILLVGSNPLPNYLTTIALNPHRVYLVYSSETFSIMERLDAGIKDAFKRLRGECDSSLTKQIYVSDPTSSCEVSQTIGDLIKSIGKIDSIHLNYTGGTKVMSSQALLKFYEMGGSSDQASYLDEKFRRLRFDSGREQRLGSLDLDLDRILQLHNIKAKSRSIVPNQPTKEDVIEITRHACKSLENVQKLYNEILRLKALDLENAKKEPFIPRMHGLNLSHSQIPADSFTRKDLDAWSKFLGGEWLEEWVAHLIRESGILSKSITVGVNGKRIGSGRKLEVDVAVVKKQRSYFISCTTDSSLQLCKSKAFEISVRSRQLGGDLSRAALVSLLSGSNSEGLFMDQIRADVDDAWGAENTMVVFGHEDLRNWFGFYDENPNYENFKNWLDLHDV
jgi:hypothetical protein